MRVITLGTFDMLHIGHLKLFRRCLHLGESLVVGLNKDEFIKAFKGKSPVMSYKEREAMITETGFVDKVIPNDQRRKGSTALKTILKSKADLIVVGSDWLKKDYLGQIGVTAEQLEKYGISLCFVPYTEGISTTEVKRRLSD